MKRLLLLTCLCIALAPMGLLAQNNNNGGNNGGPPHHRKGVPEMPGIGFGVAALIGVAGYLVLRRRHASQN